MELIKKYKQTEIGRIPEEWHYSNISIFLIKGADSVKIGPFGSALKKELLSQSGHKVYGQENIFQNDMDLGSRFINEPHFQKLKSCEIKPGEIIVSMMGTIGKCLIVPENIKKGIMDSHLLRLRLDKKIINIQFFIHQFKSFLAYKQIKKLSVGGIMEGLSSKIIKNMSFVLPSLKEQIAIANALSDADAWIQSLTRLIAKKRQIKQGAMQELLQPKENWVRKKLGETATLKARIGWQGLTTAEYLEAGEFFLVTGTEFKNGYIDWDNCHYVEESRYKQDRNIQLKLNDILVTKDGTIGKVALINLIKKPATLNSGVFVIRPMKNAFDPVFFYYLLSSKWFFEFLNQLSAGSTISHLYQKDFVNFVYQTPCTIKEQNEIATILSNMDAEIAVLENKFLKAQHIKQGIMQNLLTGRIRLI